MLWAVQFTFQCFEECPMLFYPEGDLVVPKQDNIDTHSYLCIWSAMFSPEQGVRVLHWECGLPASGWLWVRRGWDKAQILPTTFGGLFVIQDSTGCCKPLTTFQSSDQVGSVSAWYIDGSLEARAPGVARQVIFADVSLPHPLTFTLWGNGKLCWENINYNWLEKR